MGRFFRLAACFVAGVSVSSTAIAQSNPAVTLNPSQLGTSFDCSRTGQNIPSLVCNDPELRVADLQQMQVYYALRHAAPNRQQELRTQFLSRVQGLVSNCSAENIRATGTQKQCVTRGLADMRNFWFGQLQQTGNAAAIEEAQLNVNQLVSVQTSLKNQGLLPANSVADGVYGNTTRDALIRFQSNLGITPSGFASSFTLTRLVTPPQNTPQITTQPRPEIASQPSPQNPTTARNYVAEDAAAESAELAFEKEDYAEALRLALPLAENGNRRAQTILGELYYEGLGVRKDHVEAVRWTRLAAMQGFAQAQENLGFLFEQGHGVARDLAEAASWFRRAAAQGRPEAQYGLALLLEGQGTLSALGEAEAFYRRAASQGHALAQFALAQRLERQGNLAAQREAVRFYAAAAAAGVADAQVAGDRLNASIRQQEIETIRRQYQQRTKTLLEEVLNYTTTGLDRGRSTEIYDFWVGESVTGHKCIIMRYVSDEIISLFPENSRAELRNNPIVSAALNSQRVDLREVIRERRFPAFRNERVGALQFLVHGSQSRAIVNIFSGLPDGVHRGVRHLPNTERLDRAWRIVARECGERS
jgi:TPR repeat protein